MITLVWACTENGRKQNSPKKVLYMNLAATRLRGRPRNICQDEVMEIGRIVGGRKRYMTERNGRSS